MNQVLFHFKPEHLTDVKRLGFDYTISNNNEVDVILPDIDYDLNHYCIDPDVQLCNLYGIDYNHINCMEAC